MSPKFSYPKNVSRKGVGVKEAVKIPTMLLILDMTAEEIAVIAAAGLKDSVTYLTIVLLPQKPSYKQKRVWPSLKS
jgi:hypothetical protein